LLEPRLGQRQQHEALAEPVAEQAAELQALEQRGDRPARLAEVALKLPKRFEDQRLQPLVLDTAAGGECLLELGGGLGESALPA
jgi:hypothetical protein